MLFKGAYCIPSARLANWDYSWAGMYFATLCTQNHACFFGQVEQDRVLLSRAGEIVAEEWRRTSVVRRSIILDEWQIMPNHLHGIIVIAEPEVHRNGASPRQLQTETFQRNVSTSQLRTQSLGAIIGQFKGACTKRIRAAGLPQFEWQARFYDHLIRNRDSLEKIRDYIRHNPLMWESEKHNPENIRF